MSLEREIGNKTMTITCPNCGKPFEARVINLLTRDAVSTCPHCGLQIKSSGGLEEINQQIRDMQKFFKQLNRKLR